MSQPTTDRPVTPGASSSSGPSGRITILTTAEETDGRHDLIDSVVPAGSATPLHLHTRYEERVYVISGALTVWVGPDKLTVGAGGYYHIPLNVPHMVQGGAEDTHPHQLPGRVRRAGRPAWHPAHLATPATEPDQGLFMEVTTELGDVVLGPPGATPRGDQPLTLERAPRSTLRHGTGEAPPVLAPGAAYTDRHGAARGVGLERHPGRRPRRGGGRHQRRPGPAAAAPIDSDTFRTHYTRPVQRFYEQVAGREIEPGMGDPGRGLPRQLCRLGGAPGLAPDAREALAAAEAAGLGQSLLSMWRHQDLVPLVERLGIDRYFLRVDGLRVAGGGGKAEHLVAHLDALGVEASAALLVGDSLDDLAAAQEVGAGCVLYDRGSHHRRVLEATGAPVVDRLTDAVAYASVS